MDILHRGIQKIMTKQELLDTYKKYCFKERDYTFPEYVAYLKRKEYDMKHGTKL